MPDVRIADATQEADAQEIMLKEDDPEAVEGMLQFAYDKAITYPTPDASAENVVFCIGLLRIADKYDYPTLETKAPGMFGAQLNSVLDDMARKEHHEAVEDLCKIVNTVYDEEAATKPHLIQALVDTIFCHDLTDPFGAAKQLTKVVNDTAKKVPEIGRDLYLEMMRQREKVDQETGKSYLDFEFKVKCPSPHCRAEWMLSSESGQAGFCWRCGLPVAGWHEHIAN